MFSYYSTYGHVEKLAWEIEKGAASVEGVEAKLWQVCKPFSFSFKQKVLTYATAFCSSFCHSVVK